ncbi:MAG: GFA family protein [Chromatiales bacterium]|nr:GFA family protein [Chromatiales bacterium]
MSHHSGSCHCGAVTFEFDGPPVEAGIRCNCSICRRKGALMTNFTVAPDELKVKIEPGALGTYTFCSGVAKHHFCRRCGIYTFHVTIRKPGHYRINVGCLDGVDSLSLPWELFDGASL